MGFCSNISGSEGIGSVQGQKFTYAISHGHAPVFRTFNILQQRFERDKLKYCVCNSICGGHSGRPSLRSLQVEKSVSYGRTIRDGI